NFVNVIVSDDGLTVTDTDGDASRWPDTTRIPNPSGETIYYHPIESKIELYLTKLGESLANALRGSGAEVTKPMLTSLPKGYQLFERVRENESNVAIRKDTYLFGSD
ncbi:994_t:CDS:2, partial [Acaulospora morrowiae]